MAMSQPQGKLPTMRSMTSTKPELAADHRFSTQDLDDLLDPLRARAASHPDDTGIRARLADHDRRLDALEAERAALA